MTRVLLTGATGDFGSELARQLLATGCEVVAVVRGADEREARSRVLETVGQEWNGRLLALPGDLSLPALGLARHGAVRDCELVLHAAATTSFVLPLATVRRTNVDGTRRVLELAESLPRLTRVGHVSTAFVAGRRVGRVYERELEHEQGFVNSYEQSKYEAELATRLSALPIVVFRPSVIVADDLRGTQGALRLILDLIAKGRLRALPGPPEATIDLIGSRDAASAVVEFLLATSPRAVYQVASGDAAPRVADVVVAGANRRVGFVSAGDPTGSGSWHSDRLYKRLRSTLEVLAHPKVFDTSGARAGLGREPAQTDPLDLLRHTVEEAA